MYKERGSISVQKHNLIRLSKLVDELGDFNSWNEFFEYLIVELEKELEERKQNENRDLL